MKTATKTGARVMVVETDRRTGRRRTVGYGAVATVAVPSAAMGLVVGKGGSGLAALKAAAGLSRVVRKAKAAPRTAEEAAPAAAPAAPAVPSQRVVLRELSSAEFGLVCGKGGAYLKAIAKAHAVRAQARRPHAQRSVAAPA